MNKRITYLIFACGVLAALGFLSFIIQKAPVYLMYREEPRKSDCIIPLLGTEYLERKKEAYQLISEGYSQVLIIPPRYRLVRVANGREKIPVQIKEELSELSIRAYKVNPQYRWHENTHLELILAKEFMRAYGLNSAIIVSSPYHMRRVKLLTGYVFPKDQYMITCVPDRYEQMGNPWWMDRKGLVWVTREYAKIGWFLVYHRFSQILTRTMDFLSQVFQSR